MQLLLPSYANGASTSLVSAPLEWKTVCFFQVCASASRDATLAIASSETVIQISLDGIVSSPSRTTLAFSSRASFLVAGRMRPPGRTTKHSTSQPAFGDSAPTRYPDVPAPQSRRSNASP